MGEEDDAITPHIGNEGGIPFLQVTRSKHHLHLARCIQVTDIYQADSMRKGIALIYCK